MTHPNPREVLVVSRHDDQVPFERGSRDQTIHCWNGVGNAQSTPSFRDISVDGNDPVTEVIQCTQEPGTQRTGRGGVFPSYPFDASTQLAHRKNAQVEIFPPVLPKPRNDRWIRSAALTQFRHHVRVQEKAHSSISRGGEGSRSKSASSPTSGMASKCATNASAWESFGPPPGSPARSASRFASAASSAFDSAESAVSAKGSAQVFSRWIVSSDTRITGTRSTVTN